MSRVICRPPRLGSVLPVLRAMLAVVVLFLVPSDCSPLSPCLLDVCRRMPRRFAAVISSLSCLIACRLSACLGSCLSPASPRHRCWCLCRCHPIASRLPPRLIDTTGGAIRWTRGGSRFACLPPSARHLIRAVRHRMATGFCDCLVKLAPSCSRPMSIIGAACYPLSPNPIYSSSHLLIGFPPPPRSLDTGDGAGVSCHRLLACAARFRLRSICAGSVWRMALRVVLLAWVPYYICCRWGDVVARRFVSGL